MRARLTFYQSFALVLALTFAYSVCPPRSFANSWTPIPIPGVATKCATEEHPVQWTYCIHTTVGSQSRELLYHFHGRNGDATWWNDQTYYTGKLVQLWRDRAAVRDIPTVASISFGDLWLLTEQRDVNDGGLYSVFMKHALKTIELQIPYPIEKRMIVGESMGGVNALIVAFKSLDIFSKVASLCPPLPTVSPHASWLELYRYVERSGISWKRALMMFLFSFQLYPDEWAWENNDPITISSHYDPMRSPSLYLSCGRNDDWGCSEGSRKIVATLQAKQAKLEWHDRPGGHCDIDPDSLAEFLIPRSLGADENIRSRAFSPVSRSEGSS